MTASPRRGSRRPGRPRGHGPPRACAPRGPGRRPGRPRCGELHEQRAHPARRGLDQDGVATPGPGQFREAERGPAVGEQRGRVPQPSPSGTSTSPVTAAAASRRSRRPCRRAWPRPAAPAGRARLARRPVITVPPTPLPRMAGSAGSIALLGAPARPDLRLDEGDAGVSNADDHLCLAGRRAGHVLEPEHVRRSEVIG